MNDDLHVLAVNCNDRIVTDFLDLSNNLWKKYPQLWEGGKSREELMKHHHYNPLPHELQVCGFFFFAPLMEIHFHEVPIDVELACFPVSTFENFYLPTN